MAKRSTRPAPPPPKVAPASRAIDLRIPIAVVIGLAALVRLAATWNDLWLDEIWSLNLLGPLHSPIEIVTSLHHDNNHVLNSVFLYLLRPLGSDWLYRVPALLAGIATVALGAWVARLDDVPGTSPQTRALIAAIVLGVSLPLIQYSSEARGYALALAFGLGAIALAIRDDVRPMSTVAPAVWVLLILAFLSHALALHVMTALGAWTAVRAIRRDGWLRGAGTVAWWLAVPFAAFAAFWAYFLRGITVGGGNRPGIGPPLAKAVTVMAGLPFDTPIVVSFALALTIAAAGFWVIAQRKSDLWVLFAVGMIVSPAVLAIVQPTDNYAERYFLMSMLLWLLLTAQSLAWLVARGGGARIAAFVALAAFGVANATRVATLLRDGRGSYQEAIRWMVTHTTGDTTLIASDHDFRNRLVVEYYGPRMSKPVRYVSRADASPTQWYVWQKSPGEAPPIPRVAIPRGTYRLVKTYPTAPLSGLTWYVYERESPAG